MKEWALTATALLFPATNGNISRDGAMSGEGQPEKLKNLPNTYSKRIDEKNRLVYIAADGNYTIMSCKGHYEDD